MVQERCVYTGIVTSEEGRNVTKIVISDAVNWKDRSKGRERDSYGGEMRERKGEEGRGRDKTKRDAGAGREPLGGARGRFSKQLTHKTVRLYLGLSLLPVIRL